MNTLEIEEVVSQLVEATFDPAEFPFAILEAIGNKETTLKRPPAGISPIECGVLHRNNIHLMVWQEGETTATLAALRSSPATACRKAQFLLATDGKTLEAKDLGNGDTGACFYKDFHEHLGFFLPQAGITVVERIRENAFVIKATGLLNRLAAKPPFCARSPFRRISFSRNTLRRRNGNAVRNPKCCAGDARADVHSICTNNTGTSGFRVFLPWPKRDHAASLVVATPSQGERHVHQRVV